MDVPLRIHPTAAAAAVQAGYGGAGCRQREHVPMVGVS
jgi:hypothetical protein